jgi:hemerythrin
MAQIGYTAAPAHRAAHDELLENVARVLRLLQDGQDKAAREIIGTLPDWLEAHINTMDLALAVAASQLG